jgi:hypothetical protein
LKLGNYRRLVSVIRHTYLGDLQVRR